MPEVLVEFDTILRDDAGGRWVPRACTGIAEDGLWEGWIEFMPGGLGGEPLRTGRETEQTTRNGVMYWAQGLTHVYLEGALRRAISEPYSPKLRLNLHAEPAFDGPRRLHPRGPLGGQPRPVLNPFEVFQQGQQILLGQLSALNTGRLRDIVLAYGFASPDEARSANASTLTSMILTGVRRPIVESSAESRRDESSI